LILAPLIGPGTGCPSTKVGVQGKVAAMNDTEYNPGAVYVWDTGASLTLEVVVQLPGETGTYVVPSPKFKPVAQQNSGAEMLMRKRTGCPATGAAGTIRM
jgi:hypothetical protein